MLATVDKILSSGKKLRLARLGTGPPIVFLHGYPDNLQIWSRLAQRLKDQNEVIAFDWPGMGYSDAWSGGTTPFHLADRLATIFNELEIQQATVIGMDMGGQPSLVFAEKYPARVKQLVVMNSLVFGDEKTSWEIKLLRKYGWNRLILRRFPRLVFNRAERTFLPVNLKPSKDLRADLWESFRQPQVRSFIARLCAGYQGTLHRLPKTYANIMSPTLILWGERDKHFPVVQAERMKKFLPSATLRIVAGGEHWMPWHADAEVADALREFFKPTG